MYLQKEQKFFALLKKIFTSSHIKTGIIFSLLTIGIMLYAAPAKIPHTFKYGDIVSSSQLNANFKKLVDEINMLKAQSGGAPVGTIVPFGGDEIPAGWLLCDGTILDPNDPQYQELFTVIKTLWGGDGVTTFRVPDLRGVFLRGTNGNRDDAFIDPDASNRVALFSGGSSGDTVGSYQADMFQSHYHNGIHRANERYANDTKTGADNRKGTVNTVDPLHTDNSGGSETRPKNAAVNYIIKY